jgi:hypothetical protein
VKTNSVLPSKPKLNGVVHSTPKPKQNGIIPPTPLTATPPVPVSNTKKRKKSLG